MNKDKAWFSEKKITHIIGKAVVKLMEKKRRQK